MQGSSLFSTVAKLATVAALCVPFVAQADKSSSSASRRALCGTFMASQRKPLSANRPSRFQGQVFMQRPHMPPAALVMR